MATVRPFTGWRYNRDRFTDLAEVVVPPYDVISDEELARLKKLNPYNFSNIILHDGENKHQKAAALFKKWQREGAFVRDAAPTLYFYKQTFQLKPYELFCQNVPAEVRQGQALSRTGILCRVGLEDYKSKMIMPHEKTFSGPKADRYQLMTESRGNMEPVFLGYDSPRFSGDEFERFIAGKSCEYKFTDEAGVKHELWLVTDKEVLGDVGRILQAKKFYILDGHHRYETALQFYKDHGAGDRESPLRFALANICSFKQPGTIILPTHRLVKLEGFNGGAWLAEQKKINSIKENLNLAQLEELMLSSKTACFGVRLVGRDSYVFLQTKNPRSGSLDLEVLHQDLLKTLNPTLKSEALDIAYVKDIGEVETKVGSGAYNISFLVRPSTTAEVIGVAELGKVMPHKSTFFYPKIPSGLVVNTFE